MAGWKLERIHRLTGQGSWEKNIPWCKMQDECAEDIKDLWESLSINPTLRYYDTTGPDPEQDGGQYRCWICVVVEKVTNKTRRETLHVENTNGRRNTPSWQRKARHREKETRGSSQQEQHVTCLLGQGGNNRMSISLPVLNASIVDSHPLHPGKMLHDKDPCWVTTICMQLIWSAPGPQNKDLYVIGVR